MDGCRYSAFRKTKEINFHAGVSKSQSATIEFRAPERSIRKSILATSKSGWRFDLLPFPDIHHVIYDVTQIVSQFSIGYLQSHVPSSALIGRNWRHPEIRIREIINAERTMRNGRQPITLLFLSFFFRHHKLYHGHRKIYSGYPEIESGLIRQITNHNIYF